jgi:cation diffusion facilitator family transporter
VESFSALIETALLLITCVWIIIEAVKKLLGEKPELKGVEWGALLIIVCIIVDITRSRVLMKAAKQHHSQALKADALHFSTDVWSSSVVVLGLICVWIGNTFHLEFLRYADPIAALGVALLVIKVSISLGRETVDSLLDTAPNGMKEKVEKAVGSVAGVLEVTEIRIRPSGAIYYVELGVGLDPNLNQKNVHHIVHQIKDSISADIDRCDITVSTFPVNVSSIVDTGVTNMLESIVNSMPNCENVHNIHVYEVGGKKRITAHVELLENLTLKESHDLSHKISDKMQAAMPGVDYVNLYFQRAQQGVKTEDVTAQRKELVQDIEAAVKKLRSDMDCHEVQLYKSGEGVSAFLHCGVPEDFRMDKLEEISSNVKTELRRNMPVLKHVHIHFEPMEEE